MEHDVLAFGHDLVAARPKLRRAALTLASDPNEAHELVRDTITEAWRIRHQFKPGGNIDTWLHGILRDRLTAEPRSFAED